jgi:tripartite-type tricarboxylate transporter receptor subunit TctC
MPSGRHAEIVSLADYPQNARAANLAWPRQETQHENGEDAVKIFKPLLVGLALLCASLSPSLAGAQDFPNRNIKMIVPFPAGGPSDFIGRVVAKKMSDILKQTIVVENRGGQGGVIGTDLVVRAKPDGYTFAFTSAGALAISPSMQKIPYDTLKDLQPITLVAKVPEMLVVASNVPAHNMKELVALAKSEPGKLYFASSGPGSLPHLAGELFKMTAKINIVHVPYRGAAPAVSDLLGEHVQMVFLDLPVLLPLIKAGKLRPIAVGSPKRVPSAPNVPTTAEVGMPNLLTENWYGMVAPAHTPPDVVAKLNKAAVEAMKDPKVIAKLSSQGANLIGGTPDEFRSYIANETKKWAKVIKDAGVQTNN